MISSIGLYIKEMRIKSWIKNVFVLFPIVFSLELFKCEVITSAIILFFAFCFVSSSIYVLNDIIDIEKDRKHETKKKRPIAAGKISVSKAWILLVCLMIAGLGLSIFVNLNSFILIVAYVVINVFYSKWLKRIELIDCFCVAAGFVIRVLVGGTIVSAGVSNWMFLTVVAMSLFMAFGKRRGELQNYAGNETRLVLDAYDIHFLDGMLFMCAGLTMVFYSLWSISAKTHLVYTVPVVLFIVIRYLYLVFKGKSDGDPTSLILSDKMLLLAGAVCGVAVIIMLYYGIV